MAQVVSCAVLVAASAIASSSTDFFAAGVLLTARDGGSVFVLLGKDRYRPWYEMLAGRRDVVEHAGNAETGRSETAYETALRECHEESRGYFTVDFLQGIVDPDRFLRDGGFVFFYASIEKFPLEQMKNTRNRENSELDSFREMADYAWVAVDEVLQSLDNHVSDEAGRRIRVRRELKSRLLRARQTGWF